MRVGLVLHTIKIMTRTEVNVTTGETTIVPLTEVEIAEINAMKAEQAVLNAQKQALQAAYDQAAYLFSTLNLGKQALWEPVRKAVGEAILAGDMVTAREILETVPALYPDAEADRALFLSLFQ